MRLFECQSCGQPLYFENTVCEQCGRRLGFLLEVARLSALEPAGGDAWHALAAPQRPLRFCANAAFDACNWLVPADRPDAYCGACRHNSTVPDLSVPQNLANWQKLERARHRLFYSLLRLGLPHLSRAEDPVHGLAFDVLADPPSPHADKVMTGHDSGLITINLAEADDAARERIRLAMGEPYRTLLGHFRHEIGHYYWDLLVWRGTAATLQECRAVFGDDQQDYGSALQAHYRDGSPANWQDSFVSQYAAAHPWEDFAETWAHYLHIVDTLETARAFGLSLQPRIGRGEALQTSVDFNPYASGRLEPLVEAFLPVTFAVNGLNRSMGQPDLYPFVLSPRAIGKLDFVHRLCLAARGGAQFSKAP